jgi:RNA polymerase sigma factor (sigma-70 family)
MPRPAPRFARDCIPTFRDSVASKPDVGIALAALMIPTVSGADEPIADAIQRAQSGDVAAFAEIYRAHVGRIHALCRRLCGDAELAGVLTQDVFVRAWEKLAGFRGDAAFSTWLHRLAVNLVLGDRRTRLRRAARELVTAVDEHAPLQRIDAGMDLERAIAALPAGARAVFVLFEIEGHTHEEIAEMMDLAVGTSKAQLHRARALLRGALG